MSLLLGSAESAAADFSQAPLMVLYSSLLICSCSRQVRKDLPVPCFYGHREMYVLQMSLYSLSVFSMHAKIAVISVYA
jgi:hypothetical protein